MSPPADDGNEIEFLTPTTSQGRRLTDDAKPFAAQTIGQITALDGTPEQTEGLDGQDSNESVASSGPLSAGTARRSLALGGMAVAAMLAILGLALMGRTSEVDVEQADSDVDEGGAQESPSLDGLEIGPEGITVVPAVDDLQEPIRLISPLTGLRDSVSGVSLWTTGYSAVLVHDRKAMLVDLDSGDVAEVPGYVHAILAASDDFLVTYGADGGSSVLVSLDEWPLRSVRLDRNWVRVFLDSRQTQSVLALIDERTEQGLRTIRRVYAGTEDDDVDYVVGDLVWNNGTGLPIGTSPGGGVFELWPDAPGVSESVRTELAAAYARDYPAGVFPGANMPLGPLRYVAPGELIAADESRALIRDCDRTDSVCSLQWFNRLTWQSIASPMPESSVVEWRIDGGGRWLVLDNGARTRLVDLVTGRRLSLDFTLNAGVNEGPVQTFLSSDGVWLGYQDGDDLVLVDLVTSAQFRSTLPEGAVLSALVRTPAGLRQDNAAEPNLDGQRMALSAFEFGADGAPDSLVNLGIVATGYLGATTVVDIESSLALATGGLSEVRMVQGTKAFGLTPNDDLAVLDLVSGDLITRSLGVFRNVVLWEGYLKGTMWVASTDENRSLFDVILVEQDTLGDRIFLTEAEIQFLPPVLPGETDDTDDDGSGANRLAGSGRWRIVYDRGGRSYLVETDSGKVVFLAEGGPELGVDVSDDGRWVIVANNRGEIVLADLDSAIYNDAGNAAIENLVQYKISGDQKISSVRFAESLS